MSLIIYYLVLPFFLGSLLIRWLKKHSPARVEEDVRRLYEEKPLPKKWFRALRRDHQSLRLLGDFETQPEAVEAAYQGRKDAKAAGEKASFFVLNSKAETLEQIDS